MRLTHALSLKQLRALAAVARTESLARAAETLGVTAPAISTQIRTLEGNLGAKVIDREGDGKARLTAIGAETLAAADQIETILEQYVKRLSALQAGRTGHVSIGAVSTGKYFAPGLVARIKAAMPEVEVTLTVANRDGVIEALETRRIDLAIMGRPPRQPLVEADLVGPQPYVLIAPPGSPHATKRAAGAEELLSETILCREPGSGTRILSERFFDRIGEGRLYERQVFDSNETIKQAVIAGLGIALISAHTIELELSLGRIALVRAPGLPIIRHWHVVRRADSEPGPAAERVRAFILGLGGAFLPRPDLSAPP